MVTPERTASTRLLRRVRTNAVAGLVTIYVVTLCLATVLGPLVLAASFDMGVVAAIKHVVGVVGIAYLLGVGLLFR